MFRPASSRLLVAGCFAAILSLAACRTYPLADEPADLIASGRTIAQLEALYWSISSPRTTRELEATFFDGHLVYAGDEWEAFKIKLQPGDELREVKHNAGMGAAIFRRDVFLDMYLWAVF